MEARGVRVTANLLEEERPPEGLLDLVGAPSSSGAGRGAAAGKDKDVHQTPHQTEHLLHGHRRVRPPQFPNGFGISKLARQRTATAETEHGVSAKRAKLKLG